MEQVKAVVPLALYLPLFQILFLQCMVQDSWIITGGLLPTAFMEVSGRPASPLYVYAVGLSLALAMGLGLGNATHAVEGFGILCMASIGPIIAVMITGLWARHKVRVQTGTATLASAETHEQ
jgi:hypothetical protein